MTNTSKLLDTLKQIDNYIGGLPEAQQGCIIFLRRFLLDYSPEITLHFRYSTAFFHYKKKPFCYFSYSKKQNKTYLGFVQGYRLKHPSLVAEGRSQIKVFYIDPEEDLDLKSLKQILKLAIST